MIDVARMTRFVVRMSAILVFIGTICPHALSQSFIFDLPKDGAWAKYENSGSVKIDGNHQYNWEGPVTIRCVGTEYEQMEALRWIEIEQEFRDGKIYQRLVFKVLIPEDEIGMGKDPLSHVRKCWVCKESKAGPLNPTRLRMENNSSYKKLLSQYLAPPICVKSDLAAKEIVLNDKSVICKGISGTLEWRSSTRYISKRTYESYISPISPFGLVQSNYEFVDEQELGEPFPKRTTTKTSTCKLIEFGTGAVSVIPNCK